jgi:hypothetical protein
MRPTTSNIFHTTIVFHPSSLAARRSSLSAGTRDVGSQWCSVTRCRYGTTGMESSSWVLVGPEVRRISQGGNG